MSQVFGWMLVVNLCCAVGAAAGEELSDARLQEAQTAFDEATKLREEGKYADAFARAEHALTLREELLGGSHPLVGKSLNQLGAFYANGGGGDRGRSESLLLRALGILEATLGKNHPDVATSLYFLSLSYEERGEYEQAEASARRALAIREETLGKDHPDVSRALGRLARIYREQGLYSRAEPLLLRSLAIAERTLGENHPGVGNALNGLAILYWKQGLYDQAEPLYQRSLAIQEAARGRNHPEVAPALGNLALLYMEQGLYAQAEPLFLRSLALREQAMGKSDPVVAHVLQQLAVLYMRKGLPDRAEPLLQRALAIWESLDKNHPDAVYPTVTLSNLYWRQGLYARAESILQRALVLCESSLGKHPLVAILYNNLANLYLDQGRYDRAEPYARRALAIREATLSPNHPDVAASLRTLGELHLFRRRSRDALPLLTRAFAMVELRLRHEALGFSESRLATFLQYLREEEERIYALQRANPEDAGVRRLALTAALLLKGRSVDETAKTSRVIYRSLGAEAHDMFERLRGLRTQLTQLTLEGPGSLAPAEHQRRLRELTHQCDALEAELAQRSAPLRALAALPGPEVIVDRVAAALPRDSALLELISYTDRPLAPKAGHSKAQPPGQQRYLALVLFPNGRTRALDLGPAAPIDTAATALRDALARRDAAFQAPAQVLYQRAFRPLLPLLGDTRHVFLSTDGQLGLVPFTALHDGRQFLVDSFDFTYLTSGKDLLPRSQQEAPSHSVVVVADPDFGALLPAPSASPANAATPAGRSSSLDSFFSTLRADVAEHPWTPLPGSRQEAEAIQRLVPQAQLFLGAEATKERLLHLPTPGVLHLATHGFFLEAAPAPEGSRGLGHFGAMGDGAPVPLSANALLRSGLVLAGASAPSASSTARTPPEVALVTALELAGLNLWGTQLVVLSACDTGRGDVKIGQGVYGLRRAFVAAGAETVVMSLWKVNDETTRELMEAYYRNLLTGQGRAAALREAMRSLRATRPHPHYWAPFIAVGRDAPLRGLGPTAPEPPEK
ncbi:hypothetical protein D187_003705 [Cystobacter fuscus DSM 2262]|uniref:CHAT domain-containing protein n=1 Tax=Cystobacter fuscus (strain ATCC 25194 / DSM 2262 / NBRC 100088 / M29) TaxID=1242864 RepID=S9QBQ4_CYSF2|nr:tetratricopeptide repeat protein [Cystobacter fuscus]EPX58744.1 hypothetical protein D187_003705 [Cystobacter fuscus DSM 2262]